MSTLILVTVGVVCVVGAALLPLLGIRRLAVVALAASLLVAPYPLANLDTGPEHHGITSGAVAPYTYSLAIAVWVVFALRHRTARLWLLVSAGVVSYLLLLLVFAWDNTPAQQSGVLHLATGMVAFAAGIALGIELVRDLDMATVWVWMVLACFAVQLIVIFLQLLGFPAGLYSTTAYFVAEGRPIGTFIHPSVLGKVALLALPSLFVLSRVPRRRISALSWIAIALAVVTTVLTQSRSNTFAVLAAVAIWFVLDYRSRPARRLALVVAVAIVSIPAGIVLLPRILSDPTGGDRAALLTTALSEIPHHLTFGMGANSYSDVVGQFDPLAASGLPVHNTLLHSVAELGVVGTILTLLPVIAVLVRVAQTFRAGWPQADAARSLVTILPGLVVIYAAGWGLLLQGVFVFWMLSFGVAFGMMAASRTTHAGEDLLVPAPRETRVAA